VVPSSDRVALAVRARERLGPSEHGGILARYA
jgi:hypothetical protein